jgi:hypothetical protein
MDMEVDPVYKSTFYRDNSSQETGVIIFPQSRPEDEIRADLKRVTGKLAFQNYQIKQCKPSVLTNQKKRN